MKDCYLTMTLELATDSLVSPIHSAINGGQPSTSKSKEDAFPLECKEVGKEKINVCFLSGKERQILSGGHSRFDRQFVREAAKPTVGPGSYQTEDLTAAFHHTLNKVTSKVGYGGLASRAPRFAEKRRESQPHPFIGTPFHKRCLVHVPKIRVGKYPKPPPPFGSAIPRNTDPPGQREDTPGFYYDIARAERERQMPFDHTFGGRTRMIPHVLWKCTPVNLDICCRCELKPQGDYYFSGQQHLCRPCYRTEWNTPDNFNRKQLEYFKKIRDCTDIHKHEGTTAAYPLMSDKDIRRLRILECYFASYEGKHSLSSTIIQNYQL